MNEALKPRELTHSDTHACIVWRQSLAQSETASEAKPDTMNRGATEVYGKNSKIMTKVILAGTDEMVGYRDAQPEEPGPGE